MPKTIRAVFEHGVFRPSEPVDLPDPCEVEVQVHAIGRAASGELSPPVPAASWEQFFATKLATGSALPKADKEEWEATADDLLF